MAERTAIFCLPVLAVLWALPALAQVAPAEKDTVAALKKELQRLRERLDAQDSAHKAEINRLTRRIEELESGKAGRGDGAADADEDELGDIVRRIGRERGGPGAPLGSLGRALQNFNPDISIIGDFVGHFDSREGGDLDDEWLFRELEIGISGDVDPHARADVFIGIHRAHAEHEEHEEEDEEHDHCGRMPGEHGHAGEYELHLEEAYLTLLDLPCDLKAKVGKFRASFGRTNTRHLHSLSWVEYPLVVRNFLGPEGLAGEGVSGSWLVPNPWDQYVELTYELFNNDDPNMFAGEAADDFVHLVRVRTSHDLTNDSTIEFGLSGATAPNDSGHGGGGPPTGKNRTWMEGADMTYKWRHPEKGMHRAFTWQTEILGAQKRLPCRRERSIGLFTAADYQFDRRWTVGGRCDYCQWPDKDNLHESAYSAYLTFLQSEYCFWRFGYQYSRRNFEMLGARGDHQVFLQVNFGLGPHREHEY